MSNGSSEIVLLVANCNRPSIPWDFSVILGNIDVYPKFIAVSVAPQKALLFENTGGSKYTEKDGIAKTDAKQQNISIYKSELVNPPPNK